MLSPDESVDKGTNLQLQFEMRNALLYSGAFERNFADLKPGTTTFKGSDDKDHPLEWPTDADGVRVSFMERPGKHFVAVRIQHGPDDVVLGSPVLLEPSRHLGGGRRFGPEPIMVPDEMAKIILEDAIARNEGQRDELTDIRLRFRKS
jgi:hypothetical protein